MLVFTVMASGAAYGTAAATAGLNIVTPIFDAAMARMVGIWLLSTAPGHEVFPMSPWPPTTSALACCPGRYFEVPAPESDVRTVVPLGSRWNSDSFHARSEARDSLIAAWATGSGRNERKSPIAETANVLTLKPAVWPPITACSMPPLRPS